MSEATTTAERSSGTNGTGEDDAPQATRERSPWLKVLGVVVGLAIVVPLMLFAFLSPQISSGAEDLPLGVSGPSQVTDGLEKQLDSAQPGAFEITEYDSSDEVSEAVLDRDTIGGISVGEDGTITITTAGGAGTPYAQLLQGMGSGLEQSGAAVTYDDVAPLSQDDPSGIGLSALALPLVFGGMISAVLLSTLLKGRPGFRILGSAAASLVVGFAVTAVLQFGFGSVDGNCVLTALALALGTAAISMFILGMESLLGFPGLGIGAVIMMFLGNPLSGMATGWQWLPSPWGVTGQILPPGSAGTLLRSVAFFDGHGSAIAILVLACWVALGIVLVGISALRARRTRLAAAHSHVATAQA
jgi:hypothetical protein